jgi:hypothetical protein
MFRKVVTSLLLVSLAAVVAAALIRDREPVSMLLLCVPAWPTSLSALGWDAWLRGRALRWRGLLSGIAIAAGSCSLLAMWTPAHTPEGTVEQSVVRVVQWNVQWGGERRDDALMDTLDAQAADIICLSEAPRREDFDPGWRARHPSWHTASVENPQRPSYWYRLTVTSRHPVHRKPITGSLI